MSTPYERALAAIDAAHAEDPTLVPSSSPDKAPVPYELHYAEKMSEYLTKRSPGASEPLRLAIRSQHLRRWEVPRASYPSTKPGYFAWRTFLKKRQAELAARICLDAGYDAQVAERVARLVRKDELRTDEETQVLEDVACLVFLDDQFEAFSGEHEEEKLVGIVRKTWAKMTETGREMAREIAMTGKARELMDLALAGS